MLKAASSISVSDTMDMAHLFFVNMSLLGFDAAAMERKCRIPFNNCQSFDLFVEDLGFETEDEMEIYLSIPSFKLHVMTASRSSFLLVDLDMFVLPNKKGFEIVVYFLFNRLDSARCREQFRDCWPITDKKEEQQFRKICTSWLELIVKEDPNSYLPRIGASLFMSPGGEKFYQFLFCFSRYVLYRIIVCEHGVRSPADFPAHPLLTPSSSSLAITMANATAASATVLQQRFIKVCQQTETLQNEWVVYADELTKEYRALVRQCRDLEHELKSELHKISAGASPKRSRQPGGASEYDREIQTVKRSQAVQQVRNLWKSLDEFRSGLSSDREVVESILHRTVEKYRLDATDLSIKLPDLLIRECEHEIQRRNVENIYKEGKVNLLSLVHLWNLSLHLYIEKMHEAGLPHLDEFIVELHTMLQTHRTHLGSAESLKNNLEHDLLPEMKENVEQLKQLRDSQLITEQSPSATRWTSLGLGLMPPTPPVSFAPQDGSDSHKRPSDQHLRLQSSYVSTPEGASQLLTDIESKIRSRHDSSLVQGQPVYAPRNVVKPGAANVREPVTECYHEQPGVTRTSSARHEDVNLRQSNQSKQPPPSSTSVRMPGTKPAPAAQARHSHTSKTVARGKTEVKQASLASHSRKPVGGPKPAGDRGQQHQSSRKLNVAVDRHMNVIASTLAVENPSERHLDFLVDRVVNTMMTDLQDDDDDAAVAEDHFDPTSEMGKDMFKPADKIGRTPPTYADRSWKQDAAAGPLSSTHLDSSGSGSCRNSVSSPVIDHVAIRLFDQRANSPAEAKHASRVGGDEQQQQLKSSGSDENNDNHPLPSHGSAPSSIHSVSTHDASDNSFSDESHASLSILESIGGRTRDRVLATDVKTDCETYGLDHRPPVENVADGNVLADLGLDCLDETIQSLLDTKTPMLPLRFRSNIDGRQVGGGRTMLDSGSTVNRTLTSDIDTDATPILVRKTGELANRNSRAENVNRSQDGVQKPSRLAAPSTVADAAVNADSRLPQPDASEGPRTLESLADLDNLIARYRNIRSVNTDSKPGHSSSSFDQNSNLKNPPVPATGALPEDGLQNPVDNVEKRETLQHSRVDGQQTKRASLDFAATLNLSAECGLDNDDFEDIRPNLLNISTDDEFSASATPHVLQRAAGLDLSRTLFHAMPLSPFTDIIHSASHVQSQVVDPTNFEVTTRISDILDNDLLRENSSLLVPASPADNVRTSVATADLVDLS